MSVNINCDMGESFGLYQMGDDEAMMPHIDEANVACGFHGSDPNHMRRTVELAKRFGVKVGAHFSLPDLPGFGRREMKIDRDEMANIVLYQIGALKGFLEVAGIELNHLKPHGALYSMAARQEHIAEAIADIGEHFRVPLFGLAGTLHEDVYKARGLEFRAEFFADLDYADDGQLLVTPSSCAGGAGGGSRTGSAGGFGRSGTLGRRGRPSGAGRNRLRAFRHAQFRGHRARGQHCTQAACRGTGFKRLSRRKGGIRTNGKSRSQIAPARHVLPQAGARPAGVQGGRRHGCRR